MDLFKYNDSAAFQGGQPIVGWDSVAWTERYREPGEFELVGKLSSGLKDQLPIGTFVSHIRTMDMMLVENHQISEENDEDPEITITGRSLQAILEQRIVGQNWNWASPPASLEVSQYVLSAANTWLQAIELINEHVKTGTVIMAGDAIPLLEAAHAMTGSGTSEARTINRGTVLERLQEILEIDDLGCRVIRRHNFTGPPASTGKTTLLIHDGENKSDVVSFSSRNGDIDAADYLWSIKKYKTSALVSGKFVETMVHGAETGSERRVMLVDGSDLDGHLEAIPTGSALTTIRTAMTTRGNQALKAQKRISLSRIDISPSPTYEYRRDYNIGDFVSVHSSYGPVGTMRVVEHVEIEDENGQSAHPTLEIIEGE
jgi:hypothetical protein